MPKPYYHKRICQNIRHKLHLNLVICDGMLECIFVIKCEQLLL